MSERIVVGMSGGVDSSVAAALLVEQGFEVVGVTMHLAGDGSRCCSLDDADDARRVAESLGIRFYVANYTERFRREVMEPFADAYLAGRTPIPCVACNRRFKFHHLLERARAFGAHRVATGHYARIRPGAGGRCQLERGSDPGKDQSYFLFDLGQEQLGRASFPLGGLRKDEVRAHARRLGLATADKPESQEICFVPDGDYAAVVESLRADSLPGEGEIVHENGRRLGRHRGIHRFTVGQRRGLGISAGSPLYVTRLEASANRVVVGEADDLLVGGAELEAVSWVAGEVPEEALEARVQVRYRHEGEPACVEPGRHGGARIRFHRPVRTVTPGQAAVFYDGDRVLGGGWIAAPLS
ncbi:MAG: tRNA 2-thiouridine(34) synthase MnmA [Myxococcota bacterium]